MNEDHNILEIETNRNKTAESTAVAARTGRAVSGSAPEIARVEPGAAARPSSLDLYPDLGVGTSRCDVRDGQRSAGPSQSRLSAPVEIEPEENSGTVPLGLASASGESAIEQRPAPSPITPGRANLPVCPDNIHPRQADLESAQARANICQEFENLTAAGYSLNQAASALGKSPSWFSGDGSMYARWRRDGLAGLLVAHDVRSASSSISSLTRELESLPWFVPAGRFFYLLSNRSHAAGSVPESIRRVISLPHLPVGWTHAMREKFLKVIYGEANQQVCPTFPPALREQILAREAAGQPMVPERIARQIRVNASVVQHYRSPRDWSLANQSAPGSQRRFFNMATCQREIMEPGDWFGGDDATPGIAVCVPCKEIRTPCSIKYGVLLGRYQWLAYHDAGCDKILASDYIIRPRGSYRAEDILNGMGAVTRVHGIPRQGFQFEGGAWNSKLVQHAIKLLGCAHWRTYSPHQKAIESIFNRVWTRLAVQFPHADMGRYQNENEANCHIYEACKAGHQDPRRYFPTIDLVVKVFEEEVSDHNARKIFSNQYGQWIPDELFDGSVAARPLRPLSREMDWIFSPYSAERTVHGMLVGCRVPMFESFSVPFEFGADWLPHYNGKKVRLHFNPRQPRCVAKLVLMQNATSPDGKPQSAGGVLGDATLIGETAGYIRYILDWASDDQRAGYLERQRVANFVRRETRGIGTSGRVEYSQSEQRNGLDTVTVIERQPDSSGAATQLHETVRSHRGQDPVPVSGRQSPGDELTSSMAKPIDRAARLAELDSLRRKTENLFL